MADAAGLDFDSHPTSFWFGNIPFNDFERSFRTRDLHDAHFRHDECLQSNCRQEYYIAGQI